MEGFSPRRVGLTTWVVLALCVLVGVVAVAMTAVVIVRLNRQVLASAAELRASLGSSPTGMAEPSKLELLQYAAEVERIESVWAQSIADYRLRYPSSPIYESIATAQAVAQVNGTRRPPAIGDVHERWAQAWSDRDAAMALLGKASATEEEKARAAELGRKATDEVRRARNELRDLLTSRGITDQEVAVAKSGVP
jgi:cell division protein FtsL